MDSNVVQRKKKTADSSFAKPENFKKHRTGGEKKGKSQSFAVRFIKVFFIFLAIILSAGIGVEIFIEAPINSVSYSLPTPPEWKGPLAPNDALSKADHLFKDILIGPESLCFVDGSIFTTTFDGKIVEIKNGQILKTYRLGRPPCGTYEDEPTCGRPLGIKQLDQNSLIIADAYLGLFLLNRLTGESKRLVEGGSLVDGKRLGFLNDVAILSNKNILFTDSSSKWQRRDFILNIMEHPSDGRLLSYDMSTGKLKVLLENLHFPNGLQLSKNEEYVLISESTNARILKYYLKGEKSKKLEVFVDNLPGLPDNIRQSRNDSFWIGIAIIRNPAKKSLIDLIGPYTSLRNFLAKILPAKYIGLITHKMSPKYGLAILIDENGKYVSSLHDPMGKIVPSVSEVEDTGKSLYFGSYHSPFLAKIDY